MTPYFITEVKEMIICRCPGWFARSALHRLVCESGNVKFESAIRILVVLGFSILFSVTVCAQALEDNVSPGRATGASVSQESRVLNAKLSAVAEASNAEEKSQAVEKVRIHLASLPDEMTESSGVASKIAAMRQMPGISPELAEKLNATEQRLAVNEQIAAKREALNSAAPDQRAAILQEIRGLQATQISPAFESDGSSASRSGSVVITPEAAAKLQAKKQELLGSIEFLKTASPSDRRKLIHVEAANRREEIEIKTDALRTESQPE